MRRKLFLSGLAAWAASCALPAAAQRDDIGLDALMRQSRQGRQPERDDMGFDSLRHRDGGDRYEQERRRRELEQRRRDEEERRRRDDEDQRFRWRQSDDSERRRRELERRRRDEDWRWRHGGDWRDPRYGRWQGYGDSWPHYMDPPRRWRPGDRLPMAYRAPRYVVTNWYAYHLPAPPVGMQWLQIDGDYVLVSVATGQVQQWISGY